MCSRKLLGCGGHKIELKKRGVGKNTEGLAPEAFRIGFLVVRYQFGLSMR
ncbi:MAG: hypothetical protein JSS67_11375 [Bacteroidetes bacterium]|nr:hypothetical protein [Bacteroidota bacterium]